MNAGHSACSRAGYGAFPQSLRLALGLPAAGIGSSNVMPRRLTPRGSLLMINKSCISSAGLRCEAHVGRKEC